MMRHCLSALVLVITGACTAQNEIEDVRVETYYISDADDATDEIGGTLAPGSRTYRIFLDLGEGCSLRALYGDTNHVLSITCTAPIFNNLDRGRTYGHQINNSALDENTVAVDSWLSFGAASNQKSGVEKTVDADGSIVGGANNDGGSGEISGGLLTNADAAAGIPLTEQDGLVNLNGSSAEPPSFLVQGDDPSDVLGDETFANGFVSDSVRIGCSVPGVTGPDADNVLLIAQITTTGELEFMLNVEIQRPNGTVGRFVANDSILLPGETANGLLAYPPMCGCTDPNFLEYDPAAGCDDGSCATTIVFGCMDTIACNFNAAANFHVQQLCCYSLTDCNNLDPYLVCADVGMEERRWEDGLTVFPNPAGDHLTVQWARAGTAQLRILDAVGRTVQLHTAERMSAEGRTLDLSGLAAGVHVLMLTQDGRTITQRFVKQ